MLQTIINGCFSIAPLNTGTKTSLDPDGNVLRTKGDQISVFAGSTVNEQYQVTDASDGQTSAGLSPVTDPSFIAGGEIENNVAFYPYASSITIAKSGSGYALEGISLPATQSYAEGSFGKYYVIGGSDYDKDQSLRIHVL